MATFTVKNHGDIFDSNSEALVNPVNCVGVMGAGLALEFKRRFPGNFERYKKACANGKLSIGKVLRVPRVLAVLPNVSRKDFHLHIINFPTKNHWKEKKSKISYIRASLKALAHEIRLIGIGSVSIPAVGCGLGGLNWSEVEPEICNALNSISWLQVRMYPPR